MGKGEVMATPAPDQGKTGFPQALGTALGVGLSTKYGWGDLITSLLTLVGLAIGYVIDDWWGYLRARGQMWREASIEREQRAYEQEFGPGER